MYQILAIVSVCAFVGSVITGIPELTVIANVTMVLAIVTFITKMANMEQFEQKPPEIKQCPPHAWNHSEAGIMFCKVCGRKPLAD